VLRHGKPVGKRDPHKNVGSKLRTLASILITLAISSSGLQSALALPGDEHDIAVKNLSVPLYTGPSVSIYVNATITNLGINDETNIRINLMVNNAVDDFVIIPILESGKSTNASFTWSSATEGLYKMGIQSVQVPWENDITNNILESNVVVTTGPADGKVGLISTENELQGLESILYVMNANYDFFDYNKNYDHTLNLSLLLDYRVIIYSLTFGISQEEYDVLSSYIELGGHIMITGYGSLEVYTPLVDLVGTSTYGIGESYWDSKVKDQNNPITKGIYAQYEIASKVKPVAQDFHRLEANVSLGVQTVLEYVNGDDMVIYRTLPSGGTVAYWNDNGYSDWTGDPDCENMFKNYIDWHLHNGDQVHDLLVNQFQYPVFSFPGELHAVSGMLYNRGTSDESMVTVQLLENWAVVDTITINSLSSWDFMSVSFDWTAPTGADGVYELIIFAKWRLGETVIFNNYVRGKLYVGSNPQPGRVALISDNNELEGIAYLLEEMGLDYDILSNNYQRGSHNRFIINYTEDMALLFSYQTVILYKEFRTITQLERDAFMAYSRNGGSLLMTGPVWVSGTNSYDTLFCEIFGLNSTDGQLYLGGSLIVNESTHPIMNGPYGTFPEDYTLSGLSPFVFGAEAEPGTITVADLGGKVYEKITSLEQGGRAVFWNGDGADDWSKADDTQNMFKNYLDWSMFIPQEDNDIWVTLLEAPDYAIPNNTLTVNVTVLNRGLLNSTNVQLNLKIDGITVDSTTIPLILPGEFEKVTLQWTPQAEGEFTVKMEAEALPGETRTDNNAMSKKILVYFPVGYILVDQGHDNTLYHERYFRDLHFKRYWVNYTDSALDQTELSKHDILFVIGPQQSFSSYEVQIVKDFVASGHGLMVVGGSISISDDLTSFSDIHWASMNDDHWGISPYIMSHPVTQNVEVLPTGTPFSQLTVSGRAQAIVHDSANDTVQGAASTYYSGNILALVDGRFLSDIFIELNDTKLFGRNIVPWLLGKAAAETNDVSVIDINAVDFMKTGDITSINASVENHGIKDEHDVIAHLKVDGTIVDTTIIPYLPPIKLKVAENQNLMIIDGTVELTSSSSDNIVGEADLSLLPIIDPASDISDMRNGVTGNDSSAVFFAQGTSGPGEYVFSFPSRRKISRIRFYQDDEYVAKSYRVMADTNNDSLYDTVIAEVLDDSARGNSWATHDFSPTDVYSVKFQAISGVEDGSFGQPRAYPTMHEFIINYHEYAKDGVLVTDAIEPDDLNVWKTLIVDKNDIDADNRIMISVLDGSTQNVIPGFDNLPGTMIDISSIDPVAYPSLRLRVWFISHGKETSTLYNLSVSWVNATTELWWMEPFAPRTTEISFIWRATYPDEFDITIHITPLPFETVIDNNEMTKTIIVFTPKAYVLVDMGHSNNNTGYENFYWEIFKRGYWINYTYSEITSSMLDNVSLFITVNPEWGYDFDGNPNKYDPEIVNVSAFVDAGGGMFMIGHYNSVQCYGVTKFAGVKWITDSPMGGGETANILPHYVTYGTERLTYAGFFAFLSLSLSGNAKAVVYDSSSKLPTIQGAVSTYGSGRIVTLVNYDWFRSSYLFRTDNKLFARNIVDWLMRNDNEYDLSVRNPNVEPHLKHLDVAEVTAEVWNMGLYDVSNVAVSLLKNGTEIDIKTITSLSAGNHAPVAFSYIPPMEGIVNLTVEVIRHPLENITSNNRMSIDTRVFIPKGYVLVDDSHQNDNNHQDFYEGILSQNYWIEYSTGTVNMATLSGYDVFISSSAKTSFDKTKEAPAMESYVANGGGFLAIADSKEIYDPLTDYSGITWTASGDFVPGSTWQLDSHPTTVNISQVMPGQSSLVIETRSTAQGVVYDGMYATIKGAAARYGKGKILALAGAGWLSDDYIPLYDTEAFGQNIITWLFSPQEKNETSLSNLNMPSWIEPVKNVYINATLHNWHTDRTDITVEFLVGGIVNQTRVFNFSFGASRLVEFNWTSTDTKQNTTLQIRIPAMPGENDLANNELTGVIYVRPTVGRILFDQSHYADELGLYKYLLDELELEGYEINTTNPYNSGIFGAISSPYGIIDYNEPVTSLKKARYDALIIPQPLMYYNSYVISEIEDYVRYGGGLFVVGDDETDLYNNLTAFANISWEYAGAPGDSNDISIHGITQGVSIVDLQCPMARLHGGQSIVRDGEGDTMLAISTDPGRVAGWVDDGSFWNGGILEDDNLVLALNIIKWLTFRGSIPLQAPWNLTAAPNGTGVDLKWEENREISVIGYEIRRNETSGGIYDSWPVVATVGLSGSYHDDDVESETTYYYVVRAFDWGVPPMKSPYSNEASATVIDYIPPHMPAGLNVTALPQGNALTIEWINNSESDVQGYILFRSKDNITWEVMANLPGRFNTTFIDDDSGTGLINGDEYYYRVLAYDEIPNNSSFSQVASGIPFDIDAPPTPTGLVVTTLVDAGHLRLDWNPNPDPDWAGFVIYRSESSGGSWMIINDTWTLNFFIDTQLASEVTYYYMIQAFDEVPNYSPNSSEAYATTIDYIPPAAPVLNSIIPIPGGNALNISWLPNIESDLVNYSLYRSLDGLTFTFVTNVSVGTEYYLDMPLIDGRTYYYFLLAADEVPNYSNESNLMTGVPKDIVAPQTPANLNINSTGTNSLNISWDQNTESDLNRYRLYWSSDNVTWYSFEVFLPEHWKRHQGLTEGVTYYYKVAAADEVPNLSPNSTTVSITIIDILAPKTPSGFAITGKTGDTLYLIWNPVTTNMDGSACKDLDHYVIYYSTDNVSWNWLLNIPAGTNEYVHSGLSTGVTVYYKISSADEVPNHSPNSTIISGTPVVSPDNTPPSKIMNLAVTVIPTGNALSLSWDASPEPDWGYYRINRSTTPGGPYIEVQKIWDDVTHASFIDTNLVDGTTYYYVVSAVDNVTNEGPLSDEASGVPQDTIPPLPPAGLAAYYLGLANSLSLIWEIAFEDDVMGYHIYRSSQSGGPYTFVDTRWGRFNTSYSDYNLQNGTYYYVVEAFDEVPNDSVYSNESWAVVPDVTPPEAPEGLAVAVVPQGNSLNLTWDIVTHNTDGSLCTDLDHYEIYRRIQNGNFLFLASVPAGVEFFLDSGLTDGDIYYYVVYAWDNALPPNPSPNSSIISGIPKDTAPPAVPAGLNAGVQPVNTIILTWDPNTDDTVTYIILRTKTSGSGYQIVGTVLHPLVLFMDESLEEDTYYYVVMASDEVPNNSSYSGEIMVFLTDHRPPARPENLTVEVVATGNELNVSWDTVTKNRDGTPCLDLAGYRIWRSLESTTNYTLLADIPAGTYVAGNREYYVDSGLTNGVTYYYRIQSRDEVPKLSNFTFSFGIPNDLFPPAPPVNLIVRAEPTGRALTLTWEPSPDKDVESYTVYRSTDGMNWGTVTDVIGVPWQFTDFPLQNGQWFFYHVTAVDDDGKESVPSAGFGGLPLDLEAPQPPSWLNVDLVSAGNALVIFWEIISQTDLAGYYLYRATEPDGLYNRLTIDPLTDTTYTDSALEDGENYYYRVACVDDESNESPKSAYASGSPQDSTAPDAPSGLFAASDPEGNGATLTWDANTDSDLQGYSVYRGLLPFDLVQITNVPSAVTSYTDSALSDDVSYYYKIKAYDEVPNLSEFSSLASAKPKDLISPGAPTGLEVSVVSTGGTLDLYWNPVSDEDLEEYWIYRSHDGVNYNWIANVTGDNTSYEDSDITDGITYDYKILAVDETSNPSGFSNAASGTPQDTTAPKRPEGLIVVGSDEPGSVTLLWQANLETDIAQYGIYRSADNVYYELRGATPDGQTTIYTDSGLEAEKLYFYRVTAMDEVPNESPQSDTVSHVSRVLPPVPEDIYVIPLSKGRALNISWTPIVDGSAELYKLYRSTDDATWSQIATIPVGTEYYVDSGLVDGETYYYRVTSSTRSKIYQGAVFTGFWLYIESSNSSSVGGVPRDIMPPQAPIGLKATNRSDGIHLTWTPSNDEDVVAYNIYRYLQSGTTGILVASNIRSTNWTDTAVSLGETYYYSVTAVDDASQESALSTEVSAVLDILISDEEFQGRPLWQWDLFFIILLMILIPLGVVFVWMRRQGRREEELYESVKAIVKEEARVYPGPYSDSGVEAPPVTSPVAEAAAPQAAPQAPTVETQPPSTEETMGNRIGTLERKLKNIELAAKLKSLDAIKAIGEAKTTANTTMEIKEKMETKKEIISKHVDAYIERGIFPDSMKEQLNQMIIGFSKEQQEQFEGVILARSGGSIEDITVDGESEIPKESIADMEKELDEIEQGARSQSQNALKAIAEAKEQAKDAESLRAELATLKEQVESKIEDVINQGMFIASAREELNTLLLGFTPDQLEQFGRVAVAGAAGQAPDEEKACQSCGSPMRFDEAADDWFCDACAEHRKPDDGGGTPPDKKPDAFDEEALPPPEDEVGAEKKAGNEPSESKDSWAHLLVEERPKKDYLNHDGTEDNIAGDEGEDDTGLASDIEPEEDTGLDSDGEYELTGKEAGKSGAVATKKHYTVQDLRNMKKTQLKELVSGLGLPTKGTKKQLLDRMLNQKKSLREDEGLHPPDDELPPSED
jgi:fibronectin type 3 domain-containing protein